MIICSLGSIVFADKKVGAFEAPCPVLAGLKGGQSSL